MTAEMLIALGAFITGIASLVSAILLNRKTMVLLEYRLQQVEKKLDSHNGYAEKFAKSTEELAEIKTDIAVIKTTLSFIDPKGE